MFLLFITLTDNKIYFVNFLCNMLMYFALYLKSSICEKILCDTSFSEMSFSEMSFNDMLFSEMSSCDVDSVNCGRSWRITIDAIDPYDRCDRCDRQPFSDQ